MADFIYKEAQELIEIFTPEIAKYIMDKYIKKNKNPYIHDLKSELDEFLKDEYDEIGEVMKNSIKQVQDVYDRVFDVFYPEPSNREKYDPLNSESPLVPIVNDIINNFERFGYDPKKLTTPKLIEELKKLV